ncbi:MAG TPA: DoxX family protein [Vicinamibacterales bacterium]
MALLNRLEGPAYALLRIVAGLLFMFHGLQKLFGTHGGTAVPLMSQTGLAGIIEFGGGILIMVGLFTSIVAFIASGEMAAAYFIAHAPRSFWPIQNAGELAALYCFVFLFIATRGAGMWSLDRARGASGRSRR